MLLDVSGETIGYDSAGSGDKTLLLLHAFPLNRAMWRGVLDHIAQDAGMRVVAFDFRGFGESLPQIGPAMMDEFVEDIRHVMEGLRLDRVVLGGLSMGGYVAFAAWRLIPERIEAMVLSDTRATADTPEGRAAREATAELAEQQGTSAVLERDLNKLFSPLTINSKPNVIEQARLMAAANPGMGTAAAARGMALRPDSTDTLPKITCPTLVLVGEQDALTPVQDARTIFERVPHGELEVIHDAGHISVMEQPVDWSARVIQFLKERVVAK